MLVNCIHKLIFKILVVLSVSSCNFIMSTDISSLFKNAEIVSDVIDVAPNDLLSVTYKDKVVEFSKELTPTQVKDIPTITWKYDDSKFYTLTMIDPDAPSRQEPKFREILHWVVVNIPGNDLNKGETLVEYRGSGPPKGTGLHRYIFLLYEQSGKLNFDTEKRINNRTREGRLNFSLRKFVEKYKLGVPVAGNMYQAQYDDYVPVAHAQYID